MGRSLRQQRIIGALLVNGALLLLVIIWTVPTIGLLVSSFRPPDEVRTTGWWTVFSDPRSLGERFTLNNYRQVLVGEDIVNADGTVIEASGDNLSRSFLNSLAVTIPATVIPILIAAFAAYGFAWMNFPGRKFFFIIVVGLLVVPLQTALIPILRDYVALELTGTFLAVWLAHTGFGLPLATYLLFNYVAGLPREIMESAFVDGASHFTTFTRLVLPLSVPALASFAIFQFLWVWNDLLVALVFIGSKPEVAVLTQALQEMVGSRGQDWHLLTAGAFITMILPLIVFFSLQRFFVRGLLAGSVKG
jgi:alpha-glucoside transport system permease protein